MMESVFILENGHQNKYNLYNKCAGGVVLMTPSAAHRSLYLTHTQHGSDENKQGRRKKISHQTESGEGSSG
jgi:hypothetical protein